METNKVFAAHIAMEIVVIGGLSYVFSKKIAQQNERIAELEKRIVSKESCEDSEEKWVSAEHFSAYQQQTNQHINKLYGVINQLITSERERQFNQSAPSTDQPHQPQQSYQKHVHERNKKNNEFSRQESETNDSNTPLNIPNANRRSTQKMSFQSPVYLYSIPENKTSSTNASSIEEISEKDHDVPDLIPQESTVEEKYDEEDLDEELKEELKELNEINELSNQTTLDLKTEDTTTSITDISDLDSKQTESFEFVVPKKKVIKKKKV